ncbi:hypothetical protein ACFL4N_03920 [Thermodesulfobacteriota bacterium]
MKYGNWVPISKAFLKDLPHDRPYTELEAMYSLQVDYDQEQPVTISGYASLWRWSRGKVDRFLKRIDVEILYPEDTRKKQNQNGQIVIQKPDRKRTDNGHKASRKRGTTKDPNPNPNPKRKRRVRPLAVPKVSPQNNKTYAEYLEAKGKRPISEKRSETCH